MKPIIILIVKLIKWVLVVFVGIIYSTIYFVYSPKDLIKEKRKYLSYDRPSHEIDWGETLCDENFWCPFLLS